jgi:hypothetical protein
MKGGLSYIWVNMIFMCYWVYLTIIFLMPVSEFVGKFYLLAVGLFNDVFNSSDTTFETLMTSVVGLTKTTKIQSDECFLGWRLNARPTR